MGASWSTATQNEQDSMEDHRCYIKSPVNRTAYEWHLNDLDNGALKKAKKIHSYYEKLHKPRHWLIAYILRSSLIVRDSVDAIKRGYLDHLSPAKHRDIGKVIDENFKNASESNDPTFVLRAYSQSSEFTKQINGDMAKNTYHELTLYCTPLNCNVLARTQDGIQAFITILFHPRLDEQLCINNMTVYRGFAIDSDSVLKGYETGAIIITATFLSTSKDLEVAAIFRDSGEDSTKPNQIFLLCTYKIHHYRRTALNMAGISQYPEENEVLIYPYVPFRILSYIKKTHEPTGKQQVDVELEEIGDDCDINSNR
ncbi:unnamed protein product [Rotaria socialis]|uniref:Mono(ADP-ribosyl)transferase n=1 Tax=Rotaria socialis TaxID=392032 RepID=A0A817WB88_9BILA|nr:unnamed protein product [Rotaria socialis]CAF4513299.1 unnamed protein product [Rotaria socialis]